MCHHHFFTFHLLAHHFCLLPLSAHITKRTAVSLFFYCEYFFYPLCMKWLEKRFEVDERLSVIQKIGKVNTHSRGMYNVNIFTSCYLAAVFITNKNTFQICLMTSWEIEKHTPCSILHKCTYVCISLNITDQTRILSNLFIIMEN